MNTDSFIDGLYNLLIGIGPGGRYGLFWVSGTKPTSYQPPNGLFRPELSLEFFSTLGSSLLRRSCFLPGFFAERTANKARENLRAFMSWAWEQDYLEKLPRFPQPKPQRDVAGRHYLTKADLNALYFATYGLPRPRGWNQPFTVGRHWRAALVVFFNYGVDTGMCSRRRPSMSRFYGATFRGSRRRRTARAANRNTAGSTIGASKQESNSIGHLIGSFGYI